LSEKTLKSALDGIGSGKIAIVLKKSEKRKLKVG